MFIAYVVVAILFAAALTGSAAAKLMHNPKVTKSITGLGVPESWFPMLAACLVAGALGLIAGIWVPALGVAAAVGLLLYFAGAVTMHLRARDKQVSSPGAFAVLALVALLLRLAA